MGDPKKSRKKYAGLRTAFSKARIEEEKEVLKKYGLKNKQEIRRAESYINRIRNQAKKLILHPEEREVFFNRLVKLGLVDKKASIDDVLALTKEKLFERRLQTIVFKKGIAKTLKEARQFIVHKKIKIKNRIIGVPGYIVLIKEEGEILSVKK